MLTLCFFPVIISGEFPRHQETKHGRVKTETLLNDKYTRALPMLILEYIKR